MTTTQPPPPDPERWWRWRRRLALYSFAAALVETAALLWLAQRAPASLAPLGATVAWTYGLWGAVICAYVGAATWSDVAARR